MTNHTYKIIVDSCCELPLEFMQEIPCEIISLGISLDGNTIIDDENFDQKDFLRKVAASPNSPSSQCPSPDQYLEAMKGDFERIYVITLSANLSGSYNSAQVAKNLYIEEFGHKDIHVFNSCSASCGETQIAYMLREMESSGMSFNEIVDTAEQKIYEMGTYFILENLESLRKAGRLTGIRSFVANTLNIKPLMAASKEGTILQVGQCRGMQKALLKLVDFTLENTRNPSEKTLMISNCNCRERAVWLLEEFKKRATFKDTLIIDTRGISSMYACDGGIIITI